MSISGQRHSENRQDGCGDVKEKCLIFDSNSENPVSFVILTTTPSHGDDVRSFFFQSVNNLEQRFVHIEIYFAVYR